MGTTYIVGAGLSYYAGLPLQAEFTEKILAGRDFEDGPSRSLVKHLDRFVRDVFGIEKRTDASAWPELEDIFTFIDLAANTGHHLGCKYSPKDLRRIRRVLIARTIRMLHQSYQRSKKHGDSKRDQLLEFLNGLPREECSFISLNWDTSLEAILSEQLPERVMSYGPGIQRAQFGTAGEIVKGRALQSANKIRIAKMHGSTNFLYCDNCRQVFWFPPTETLNVANQIVREEEWELIRPDRPSKEYWTCCYCPGVELSTRIATFSYQKALDFPMFHRAWTLAERALRRSDRWVFIGYSLPAADFEFKFLLKRVQLACASRPKILVISGGDEAAQLRTLRNYRGLFGSGIEDGKTFYGSGLTAQVVNTISHLSA